MREQGTEWLEERKEVETSSRGEKDAEKAKARRINWTVAAVRMKEAGWSSVLLGKLASILLQGTSEEGSEELDSFIFSAEMRRTRGGGGKILCHKVGT